MKRFCYGMLVLLLVNSCKKEKNEDSQNPPSGGSGSIAITAAGAPIANAVQVKIGPAGGTIHSSDGKISFSIPAGALDNEQNISLQAIENKAPMGMKNKAYRFQPHALVFKKPAKLILHYDENDIAGSLPQLVNLATQNAKGQWTRVGNSTVDETSRTISASIHHFSDYAFYESFTMKDSKTGSDTAVIKVRPGETIKLNVVFIEEVVMNDSLFLPIPMPASGYVREWSLNGHASPHPDLNLGGLTGQQGYTNAERDYVAPLKAPNPNSIAASAKLDLGRKGILFLIRNIQVIDINKLTLNGKNYDKAQPSAMFLNNGTWLNLGLVETINATKSAGVTVTIEGIASADPGIYSFSASEKVNILAHDEFGNHWSSKKRNPLTGQISYSGNVEVYVSGNGSARQVFARITGSLFGSDGTVEGTSINAVLDVSGPVF